MVERAYRELGSLEWWFRKTYGFAPTDPRFLAMTVPEMVHEYWLHTLTNRLETAIKNQVPVESLDDIIAGVTPEERTATIEKMIEAKYAKMEQTPISSSVTDEAEKETVIAFKGKSNG